jgi:exopolysaccharide biosynthesis polyprenyl glycosylphosphotransferase
MKRSEIFFGIIRLPVDFVAAVLAFFVAYELRTYSLLYPLFGAPTGELDPLGTYLRFAFVAAAGLILIFAFEGIYSFKSTDRMRREIRRVLYAIAAWFMLIIVSFFLLRIQFFSRLILGYAFLLSGIFIIIGRILIRAMQRIALSYGIGKRRVVFVGMNSITLELYAQFFKNPFYSIVGVVGNTQDFSLPAGLKPVGSLSELWPLLESYSLDEVIQTQSDIAVKDSAEILERCNEFHVTYRFVPDLLEVQRTHVELNFHKGIPVITLKETPLDAWGRVAKRLFDLIVSSIFLIILLPVFLIVAIIIKIDSKGPIFYTSKRVTTHGRTFGVHKFRSMVINADNLKSKLSHLNHREGPLFKVKNDPRITRVGNFLRKTSIDELPQLINVFLGQMSLVGPRPHLPQEVAQYEKHHKKVLAVKPGITGMAQISGRSNLTFEEEVKLDTYYIENWSLWLDVVILFKTLPVVLRGHAAD